jgi:NTF2 fold immunity protein
MRLSLLFALILLCFGASAQVLSPKNRRKASAEILKKKTPTKDETACLCDYKYTKGLFHEGGFASTQEVAFKIAEATMKNMFGDSVYVGKKIEIKLIDERIWQVKATLPDGYWGGGSLVYICKKTGAVARILAGR